jgi:recombination protein RecT
MSKPTNPFAVAAAKPAGPETLQSLLAQDKYKKRFEQVLGVRAPQFISSILSLGATMVDVEPRSVLASAAIAASLDIPINPNLGFAWIVPYKKNGVKFGSFQLGAKGVIQLAQRTGAYAGMNAEPVNAEVYKGRNEIGEPIIDWDAIDETKPVAGYVFAFKMINGFTKVCYWSKQKVERHAQRYSQSYRGGYDSPWKDSFDRMALKTVVSNELRRWGMLSVELQGAFAEDHSIRRDIDAPAEFPEASDEIMRPKFDDKIADAADAKATAADERAEAAAGLAPQSPTPSPAPEQPKRGRKPKAAQPPVEAAAQSPAPIVQPTAPAPATTGTATPLPPPATVTAAQAAQTSAGQASFAALASEPYNQLRELMDHSKITEPELVRLCKHRGVMKEDQQELLQLADEKIRDLCESWPIIAGQIRIDRRNTAGK